MSETQEIERGAGPAHPAEEPPLALFESAGRAAIGPSASAIPFLERWAKILSLPISLAIVGSFTQCQVAKVTVGKDFVQLSTEILRDPVSANAPKGLRSWAVDVLGEFSPVDLDESLKTQLRNGTASLPATSNVPALISELASALKEVEVQQRAALLGLPLPRKPTARAVGIIRKALESEDEASRKAAEEALDLLNREVSIEVGG